MGVWGTIAPAAAARRVTFPARRAVRPVYQQVWYVLAMPSKASRLHGPAIDKLLAIGAIRAKCKSNVGELASRGW